MKYFHNKYSCFEKLLYKSEYSCYNASEICNSIQKSILSEAIYENLIPG